MMPQYVEPRGLLSANAIGGATWSAMLAIGAALGGFVTRRLRARGGPPAQRRLFPRVGGVRAARAPATAASPRGARCEAFEGEPAEGSFGEALDWLRAHPGQFAAMFLKSGWGLVGGVVVLFTAFADRVFTQADARAAAAAMGVLYAARGVGALVGPFIAQRIMGQSIAGLCGAVLGAFPVAALGYLGFALSPGVWLAALGVVVAHMGGSTVWVQSSRILQLTVPNRLLGRVSSLELAGLVTTMMASMLGVAALLDAGVGPRKVALALSAIPLLTALAWAFARRRVVSQLLVPSDP